MNGHGAGPSDRVDEAPRGNCRWQRSSDETVCVDTAYLHQSDHSQAVSLPKGYRFEGTEVVAKHFGNGVLQPVHARCKTAEAGLAAFASRGHHRGPGRRRRRRLHRSCRSPTILLHTSIRAYIIYPRPGLENALPVAPSGRHSLSSVVAAELDVAWRSAAWHATGTRWRCSSRRWP